MGRPLAEFRGLLPASPPVIANGHVEVRRRVLWIRAENFGIALGSIVVRLEFELDLRFSREQLGGFLARLDYAIDLFQGFLRLALHVKRNGSRQTGRFDRTRICV